jgi:hypothetical protein
MQVFQVVKFSLAVSLDLLNVPLNPSTATPHFYVNTPVFHCISLDNKKPAKSDNLRACVLLCISLDA